MSDRTKSTILRLLAERGEMSGLEMVAASNGVLKRGTVYVTLHTLQLANDVDVREVARATTGLPERRYSLTGDARRRLAQKG